MQDLKAPYRLPLLVLGFLSLGFGIVAGLARFNLPLPATFAPVHGVLMVSGFFGTLISLERAVALSRLWPYVAPLLAGLGAAGMLVGAPWPFAPVLQTAAAAVLLFASLSVLLRQRALFTLTLLLGAASWLIGNVLFLAGASMDQIIPWWAGFLILTIAGERLELSRFMPPSRPAQVLFALVVVAFVIGMLIAGWNPILTGALVAIALWLARFDIARRTVRGAGLTRYIAVALLSGYAWLGLAGLIGLSGMLDLPGGGARDALLHAVFLGFVFSMVFGHAPIIFPSVTRFAVPYHPVFYLHLALLHLSLILRIVGDFAGAPALTAAGSIGNAATLVIFVGNTVAAVVRGKLAEGARQATV